MPRPWRIRLRQLHDLGRPPQQARILAVDSSPAWIATVREATAEQDERVTIKAIDLGELGGWGYPTTYRHRHRFRDWVTPPGNTTR